MYRRASNKLSEVVRTIMYSDIDDLLIIPFMMSDGKLATKALPEALGMKLSDDEYMPAGGRKIRIKLDTPLGTDPTFCDLFSKQLEKYNVDKQAVLIIIGFKSSVSPYTEMMTHVVNDLIERGYTNTVLAYSSMDSVDFGNGLNLAAKNGKSEVVIVPFFISCGLHLRTEICSKLNINGRTCTGTYICNDEPVPVTVLPPVGFMDVMTEILAAKAARYFDRFNGKDRVPEASCGSF